MPTIHYILNDGSTRSVDAKPGSSVMENAIRGNVRGIDAECGGSCSCATCHVYVDAAFADRLPPAPDGATGLHIADLLALHTVVDLASHPDPLVRANNGSPIILTMDQGLLDEAPELPVTVLTELLKAEARAALHPEEVRQIAAREVNVSEYWLWRAYGGDAGLKLSTTLEPQAIAASQAFADFLFRHQFIPAPVDVASWVDPGPLAAARARIAEEASAQ